MRIIRQNGCYTAVDLNDPVRSKRTVYLHYAVGRLRQMEKQFYDTDVHVEVLSEQLNGDYSHITMRFNFFPFNIAFRQDMVVHSVGSGLASLP
ncbi:hypothetical protein J4Q44_G00313560 [Coregonus suidteri]|uniref:Uncharacterized protein n=1 Tax=Coregonus suidteri TaxID=861788 RepID=A0AAN8L3Q0_9TELE